jgi:hypothetical protein
MNIHISMFPMYMHISDGKTEKENENQEHPPLSV